MMELHKWLQRGDVASDRLIQVGLLVAALLLFTVNLGGVPLRDWDEGLVAQVAREIWQGASAQTWLYPTLWGDPYLNKPTLMHCLVALSYQLGGVNEWTARLPSALLTAASVPLLYRIGREVFYPRLPALFAALVYLTTLPVVRQGRLAMLDGAILAEFLLLLWCTLRTRRDRRYALGMGVAIGLIGLTKGVMVAILLSGIALLFLVWDTPRLWRQPILWLGLLIGLIPLIAWYGAQWMHYGVSFLGKNLIDQSLARIWTDVEQNQGAPWYYLLEGLKYGAPWLLMWPLGYQLAWNHRGLSWAKLAVLWSGLYLLAISLMATKLPWYILPLYPALALISGAALAELWQRGHHDGLVESPHLGYSPWWSGIFGLLAVVGGLGSVYFAWFHHPIELDVARLLIGAGITMAIATVLISRQNPQFISVLIWGTYLSLLLLVTSPHWVWELAEAYPVKPVAAIVQSVPSSQPVYTSYPYHRPSLNFYSQHPVLPKDRKVLRRLWRQESTPYLLLDLETLRALELPHQETIGQAEGWTLVTKSRGPASGATGDR